MVVLVSNPGGPLSGVITYLDSGGNNPFSRWCPACGGNQGFGLVTGFTYSATPEPGSMVLLGTGILGLAGTLRRKLM